MGVIEVVTPETIVRATGRQDQMAPPILDVFFEPDHTTAAEMEKLLQSWGFAVLDGDGASYRVRAPDGWLWPERLQSLPEIRLVRETVQRDTLPSGTFREGQERYGSVVHTWSYVEGGPQERTEGAVVPEPVFPSAADRHLLRCLTPLGPDLEDGVAAGPGWERALQPSPAAWVLVLEHYGACDATGWVVLRADGTIQNLTVGGEPATKVDEAHYQRLATTYLEVARPPSDPAAIAALDLIRTGSDEVVANALVKIAPGNFQTELYEVYAQRNPAAALSLARNAQSPSLIGAAAALDPAFRTQILQNPSASSVALLGALSAFRPVATDATLLERLRVHPDPAVRASAWKHLIDLSTADCTRRAADISALDAATLADIYATCPQQPVRTPVISRLAILDANAAGAAVAKVLEQPETVMSGIAAVRHANALSRDDLLEALVARTSVSRDVRRVALETLIKAGRSPNAAALRARHGAYLGIPAEATSPMVGGGK